MSWLRSNGENPSNPVPPQLPKLTDDLGYKTVLDRRDKVAAEHRAVRGDRDDVEKSLVTFGDTRPLSDVQIEAMRITSDGASAEQQEHRRLAERGRELAHQEEVLATALGMMEEKLRGECSRARAKLSLEVFEKSYRPAVRNAAKALLSAVREMLDLRKFQGEIRAADLLDGPNTLMPLPLYELDGRLDPLKLIPALEEQEFITAEEARALRTEFATNG
ncbi:hypothetical protein J8F10_16625 [Gemmata sp. G18]|uniref:Uncharacterized protein n=1 Tax=Gemmata palustris TaxID=2822762 RepID=A0ABS5BT41_9BACT|nr:hypothetical protein [Gemmata palustris]MBP3956898.1 hypothetical protein [Gemmata palustris]